MIDEQERAARVWREADHAGEDAYVEAVLTGTTADKAHAAGNAAATAVIAREIEALEAENARLREALVAEREENLWSAYATGNVRGDEWTHLFMSDGEWLVRQCGFDPKQGYYPAEEIRKAIPIAATRAALKEPNHDADA